MIVTYGRSGSTLLQGLLNSIEGCYIAGENDNFVFELYQAYERLRRTKTLFGGPAAEAPTNPWYGASAIDIDRFLIHCQRMVREVLMPEHLTSRTRAFGFKEIRYLSVGNLADYLDFLSKVFPKALFVFLSRNIDDVLRSGWWPSKDSTQMRGRLLRFEQHAHRYAVKNPDTTFSITYEDIVNKSAKLKEMYVLLGAEYDERVIDRILAVPHSCGRSVVSRRTAAKGQHRRRSPGSAAGERRSQKAPPPVPPTLSRKWAKFRRDPQRFFGDSPHSLVRVLGIVYLSIARRRAPAHAA